MSSIMLMQAALAYASRGWRVHPLEGRGKKPRLADWPNRATTEERMIREWWGKWPDANIGLATGRGSGVFVIDIDGPEGERSWTALLAEIPEIPDTTLEAATGQGKHLFFAFPQGREVRNRTAFRPGLDVRGEGGYVVVPPSIHPSGRQYHWPFLDSLEELIRGESMDARIAAAPVTLLNLIAPPQECIEPDAQALVQRKKRLPWDPPEKMPTAPAATPAPVLLGRTRGAPFIERVSRYLHECAPAVQGKGGHNALLWAARAMVIGFELADADALELLWTEFNPRCQPPWNRSDPAERLDFERKVAEVRKTESEKPSGWLLDEFGLRSGNEALLAMGKQMVDGLLAGQERRAAKPPVSVEASRERDIGAYETRIPESSAVLAPEGPPESREFPMYCFPGAIRCFIETVADVQVVNSAAVGLSVLVASAAAMGNAFMLRLKVGFEVPAVLWGVVIARSGSNKSGPFREVIKPLREMPASDLIENPLRNPQGQLIVEDATIESIIDVLSRAPRGLCLANGELAGWVASFDRYVPGGSKKVSGDETVWLKLWDGDPYQKNRKTEQENVFIARAAVSVIGCIQPLKMAECFDPSRIASGLVPRLLVAEIPHVYRGWSEREMGDEVREAWSRTIKYLRTRPFACIDTATGQYLPNIIMPSMAAKERFIAHFEAMAQRIHMGDEWTASFAAKAQGMAGRLALVLHGLGASVGENDILAEVSEPTMSHAVELACFFLNEQLRLYGLGTRQCLERQCRDDATWVRTKANSPGRTSVREFQKHHSQRFSGPGGSERARQALQAMTQLGLGTWDGREFVLS